MYARARPRPGLIRPRNQTAGPKMNFVFEGVFRPVRAPKGESMVRFRPSGPTAISSRRISLSAWRSSLSGASFGYVLAMSRNVSPSTWSRPVVVRGQVIPSASRYAANEPALNVVPSNTP
jgi:hypothetical protein